MARAAKLTVRLEGARELRRELDQLEASVGDRVLREALLEGAEPIRQAASEKAPRSAGTGGGTLAENIGTKATSKKGESVVQIGPTKEAWYGTFQEFGTKKYPAQPFLRPAFDQQKDNAVEIVRRALRERILREVT